MKNLAFRYDLNGLRAYAVILVVLFHFNVLGFSAGFLGVDIFFVISGYLMSKIIIEALEQQKFSFAQFYLARIIRIFPALLFLILSLTALGYFLFIPEDLKAFAKDAQYSLGFLSNDLYYRQSNDYFAASTHDKALLHTWSLSVEWQFYLIFPVLLYVYFKLVKSTRYLFSFLIGLFIISIGLAIYISPINQMYAFFNLPTRAWELIAGGLVFYLARNFDVSDAYRKLLEAIGTLLIILSLYLFDQHTLWPSYFALMPVVGTMCIIFAQRQNSLLTKPKILQLIGSASYSIYLWHWPFAFLLGYLFIDKTPLNISIAILISFLCGWLSYHYIENIRQYLVKLKPSHCYLIFFSILIITTVGFKYIAKDGFSSRANSLELAHTNHLEMPQVSNGWCFYNIKDQHDLKVGAEGLACHIASTQSNAKSALLFGDSFAGHNIPFWHHLGKDLNLNIHTISTNWCYPSVATRFTGHLNSKAYQQCLLNRDYLKQHIANYDVLIFAGRWSDIAAQHQLSDVNELLKLANQQHKKVIIMAEPYAFDANISVLYKRSLWLKRDFNLSAYLDNPRADEQKQVIKKLDVILQAYPNTLLLTQADLFSSNHMTIDNTPYSLDGRHLSVAGSLASYEYFIKQQKYTLLEQFITKNQD